MRKTVLFGFVSLTLVLLAACSQTSPPEMSPTASTENERLNTQIASVSTATFENECEFVGMETFHIQHEYKQPKTPSNLFYIFFYSAECDGSYVLGEYEASGAALDNVDFSIDKNLKTASLTATFEVMACSLVDGNETCVPAGTAEATVNWTGVGDVSRAFNYLFHSRQSGVKETIRGHGIRRRATVRATVSYGGETVELVYPNGEDDRASLFSARYGTHIVE